MIPAHSRRPVRIPDGADSAGSRRLLKRAIEIGLKHRRSLYDSVYVALAVSQQATLITAGERLANAVAAHLPVKWLGAI